MFSVDGPNSNTFDVFDCLYNILGVKQQSQSNDSPFKTRSKQSLSEQINVQLELKTLDLLVIDLLVPKFGIESSASKTKTWRIDKSHRLPVLNQTAHNEDHDDLVLPLSKLYMR